VVLHYLRHSILTARAWWKAQTCHRHLLNICSALRNIEVYADPRNETVPDVSVARDPELNAVISALGLCSAEAAPTNQLAITMPELVSAFNKEPLEPIKAAIVLLASTGCRVGDALGLQLGNISLNGNRLDVTFTKGKGVLMRKGMYTIHTLIPTAYLAFFSTYIAGLRGKPPSTLLIPPTAAMPENKRSLFINKALKRVNHRLSTRCVRRGVLQAMSMGFEDIPPVPIETLMEYAGHLRPTTTKRYLSWGRLHGDAAFRISCCGAGIRGSSKNIKNSR
jgi:integrase